MHLPINKLVIFIFPFRRLLLAFSLILLSQLTFSQVRLTSQSNKDTQEVVAKFLEGEIHFNNGEMISNVLQINNRSKDSIKFSIDLSYPNIWKALINPDKYYKVPPGDSIFIPVRILPFNAIKGNTRYFLNAFLLSEEGKQLAYNFFFAFTEKKIRWTLDISPANKLYFLNEENTIRFSSSISNLGNEDQDMILSLTSIGNGSQLFDTMGIFLKKPTYSFNLPISTDTTFHFMFGYDNKVQKNYRISTEDYNPYTTDEEKKFSVNLNSFEPQQSQQKTYRAGKRVEFIKLPEHRKINPFNSKVLPLVMDINIYNILQDQPMMAVDLRGFTELTHNDFLAYNTNFRWDKEIFTTVPIQNAPLFVGYYFPRGSLEYNDVRYGRDLTFGYILTHNQTMGLFVNQGPKLYQKTERYGFGGNYSWGTNLGMKWLNAVNVSGNIAHYGDIPNKIYSETGGIGLGLGINKIALSLTASDYYTRFGTDSTRNMIGYGAGISYGDNYFNNKYQTSAQLSYTNNLNSYTYYNYNFSESIRGMLQNSYTFNERHRLSLTNDFSYIPSYYDNTVYYNKQFINRLIYTPKFKYGTLSTSAFYNIFDVNAFKYHSRGVSLGIGKYNFENKNRYSANVNLGYNRAMMEPNSADYFFLRFSLLAGYKRFMFNGYYNYGNSSLSRSLALNTKYPQTVMLSVSHQYVFPMPCFVLETRGSYSYSNLTGHGASFNPDFYFFTKSLWRFKLSSQLSLSYQTDENKFSSYYVPKSDAQKQTTPIGVYMDFQLGIRKEFGIPIPWSKRKYCSTEYIAFMDFNGNKEYDKGEQLLENVVINVDGYEVITNAKGKAEIENMEIGAYPLTVFSLTELNGWFPLKEDTIMLIKTDKKYIPFAKGIKIYGSIVMQRDKYAANSAQTLDLSRFKISASNGKSYFTITDVKGNYAIYLPYGTYTLSLDESMIGEGYQLVENNYEITLSDKIDNLFVPFYIVEKKRKITIKKFENGKAANSDTNDPDLKKKKKEEEEKKKADADTKNKADAEAKNKADAEAKKKADADAKKKQDELDKKKKLDDEKKKKDEGNIKNKKTQEGVIDITANGEVNANDIKNITDALLNKMGKGKTTDADKKNNKADDKKDKDKKDKKDKKDQIEVDTKDAVAKDISSLKNLNRAINKDDFNDIEIDGLIYRVQVAASNAEVPTAWLRNQFNIKQDVYLFKNDDGMMNYCLGDFKTKGETMKWNEKFTQQKKIASFITYYYNNKRVPYQVIESIYQNIIEQINKDREQKSQPNDTQKDLQQHNDSLKRLQKDTMKLLQDTLKK